MDLWSGHLRRRSGLASLAGLALFALLAALVQARLLVSADLAVASGKQDLAAPILDAWAMLAAILVSAELSVLYGVAGSLLLWRAGLGRWSAAPLAFLLPTVVEVVLKLTLQQPPVPPEFHRQVYYPFASVVLEGAFPSGHAIRSAFFCTFLVVLLWSRGGRMPRLASLGLLPLILLLGSSRVYLGYHWLSDVVAGLLLGGAVALLAAAPVAERIAARAGGE